MPPQAVNPGTAAELMRRLKGLVPAKAMGGAGLAEAAMTGGVPIFSMLGQGASMAAQAAKVKKSLDGAGLLTEGMK